MILMLKNTKEVDIFGIISSTLSSIDKNLSEHGDRVAYITLKILEEANIEDKGIVAKDCLVALLHDIGAYQKDEIKSISKFDTDVEWNHCINGHVLLENISPLENLSDSVLYHHVDYNKFDKIYCRNSKLAQLIRVADRFDISNYNTDLMIEYCGTKFNPEIVDLLLNSTYKINFKQVFKTKEYKEELKELWKNIKITSGILKEYLRTIVYTLNFQSSDNYRTSSAVAVLGAILADKLGFTDKTMSNAYIAGALQNIGSAHTSNDKENIEKAKGILGGKVSTKVYWAVMHQYDRLDTAKNEPVYTTYSVEDTLIIASNYIISELSKLTNENSREITNEDMLIILNKQEADDYIYTPIRDILIDNMDEIVNNINEINSDIDIIYKAIKDEKEQLKNSLIKLE